MISPFGLKDGTAAFFSLGLSVTTAKGFADPSTFVTFEPKTDGFPIERGLGVALTDL